MIPRITIRDLEDAGLIYNALQAEAERQVRELYESVDISEWANALAVFHSTATYQRLAELRLAISEIITNLEKPRTD